MATVQSIAAVVVLLPLTVKIAWGVWLAWGITQIAWSLGLLQRDPKPIFRASTPPRPAPRPSPARRSSITRPVAKPAPQPAPYGTSDFLAVLDQEQGTADVRSR